MIHNMGNHDMNQPGHDSMSKTKICLWIKNDDTQCIFKAVKGKNYCKLHKKFEDVFKPEELSSLERCKKCKKFSRELNKKNLCEKCQVLRNKNIIRLSEKRSKDKSKCKWTNQKDGPCPWKVDNGKRFCKRHSNYEEYTDEQLKLFIRCTRCRNMFMPEKNNDTILFKTCDKCRTVTSKKANDKQRKKKIEKFGICRGIILKTNKRCTHKCLPNDNYCGEHQSYKKYIKLTENGDRICSNWIRGCFNILDDDDLSKCKNCKLLTDNKRINKKDLIIEKYDIYKSEANRRNIPWELSFDTFKNIVTKKCYYCDYTTGIVGVDRIFSDGKYVLSNIVPCCKYCNYMKCDRTMEQFKYSIIHLMFKYLKEPISEQYYKYDKNLYLDAFKRKSYKQTINMYKYDAARRNVQFDIDSNLYTKITGDSCYYCGLFGESGGANGIDRIDSNYSYQENNIVPCCKTCNIMKNDLSVDMFKSKIRNIYSKFILGKKVTYNDDKTKMLKLLTNKNISVSDYQSARLIKNPTFYINKIYDCSTSINNFQLKLEFVNSTTKIPFSIWKFYRRYISSFRRLKKSKIVGRRLYILVKDLYTDKYVGIIALSSDIKHIKPRDEFIGWDNSCITNGRLQHLFNISTCVPTQPFGYNYNGGKLLTSLVFSKEVYQKIYETYGIYPQGFTTFGLYGKAIQYDRLPCIKFLGYTHGTSTANIGGEVNELSKSILIKNGYDTYTDKLYNVKKALRLLHIPIEDYLQSNKKGVYFGFTHTDSKKYLTLRSDVPPNPLENAKNINEIAQWWKQRWALKRHKHLEKCNRLKTYSDCVDDIFREIG